MIADVHGSDLEVLSEQLFKPCFWGIFYHFSSGSCRATIGAARSCVKIFLDLHLPPLLGHACSGKFQVLDMLLQVGSRFWACLSRFWIQVLDMLVHLGPDFGWLLLLIKYFFCRLNNCWRGREYCPFFQ